MGRRIRSNFDDRFGSRISIIYANKPDGTFEQNIQNENICKAFNEVVAGIIGREPSEVEIFGIRNLGGKLKRTAEKKSKKGIQC